MTTADIIVIGGGIAGISAGARCAEGGAKTIVLEREAHIGTHSTARSAAVYIANYGNKTLRAINAVSGPILADPEGIAEISLLSPRGVLTIADADEMDDLNAMLDGSTGLHMLSAAEAVSLMPILRGDKIAAAAFEENAQDIDVDLMLNGFAKMLRRHGGEVVTSAEVMTITPGAKWEITTKTNTYTAPIVINATGAWGDVIADMAGIRKVGLQPMRRSAAILPMPNGMNVSNWPLVASASERWYSKPMGGKLMVSPADEDPVSPHDAWPDDMVLAEGLDRFEQATTYAVTRVERSWAGLRSFVADRTLVAGFAPDAPGFFWLVGQGGYGMQTAPAMSQLAADLCLGNAPHMPDWVVTALSPARFSN
jgi:D-arginine dehydrogenase